ncbi:hypothetical protein GCM10027267_14380 [Paramicrobacterium agarici]
MGCSIANNERNGVLVTNEDDVTRDMLLSSTVIRQNAEHGIATPGPFEGLSIVSCTLGDNGTYATKPNEFFAAWIGAVGPSSDVRLIGNRFEDNTAGGRVLTSQLVTYVSLIGNSYDVSASTALVLKDSRSSRSVLEGGSVIQQSTGIEIVSGNDRSSLLSGRVVDESHARVQVRNSSVEFGGGSTETDTVVRRTASRELSVEGRLIALEGVGVGNSEPASNLGEVVRKIAVFDEHGNRLGYVAVFNSLP